MPVLSRPSRVKTLGNEELTEPPQQSLSFEAKETAWEAEGLGERLVAMVEQGSADACACLGELARSTSAIKRFFSAIGISSRRRKQLEKMGAKKALEGAAKGADAACKAAAKEALKRGFNTLLK